MNRGPGKGSQEAVDKFVAEAALGVPWVPWFVRPS